MNEEKAVEALKYALSREVLKLFAVIVLGWLMIAVGIYLSADPWRFRFILYRLLEPVLYLGGTLIFYAGLVALLYKVIRDATTGL
ncbi:MAG: hypothetical protein ACI8Z7_000740 [Candidatus Nanohaloarchaea archaeon]|jgi:hypothetical protein